MGFQLTHNDRNKLQGVHDDLVRVVMRAAMISPIPFQVTEGLRTIQRQKELKRKGMSKTLNSRHLTGHAVDIVPIVDLNGDGKVAGDEMWHHSQLVKLSPYIKQAFKIEGVAYEWGGDWKGGWDKPHWQLPWAKYPIRTASVDSDMELMECLLDDPMETPTVTPNGSRLVGASSGALGGVGVLGQITSDLQQADSHLSAGNVFGILIGVAILAGSAIAAWTWWDEAGRPLPWKRS
jgi:peptidoglycan L-alanyl-D-glutamate endopeptidase CwlK